MKSFENLWLSSNEEQAGERQDKKIEIGDLKFPHAEAALDMYKKEYKDNPERLKKIREIFYTFFEQELNNTQIYKSEKFGVEFPYTKINTKELAKALYEKHIPGDISETSSEDAGPRKLEFVFESFLTTYNGNEFTFVEEAIHQAMIALPRAIEDLKEGKEIEEAEIYTLGSPTNTVGTMTEEFGEYVKNDPFGTFGKLYAEFIEEKLTSEGDNKPRNVELFGISMGAGIAAKAGEELLEQRSTVQDQEVAKTDNLPFLQIRAEVPVAMGQSKIKKYQIPAGFAADSLVLLATKPYNRKVALGESKFMDEVNKVLEKERGIRPNMTNEQEKLKKQSLSSVVWGLGKGLTLKPETKITQVIGLKDPTMYTPKVNMKAKQHRAEYEGNLGRNIVPEENENVRTFSADMGHTRPFFRESEFRRMEKAAIVLEGLEK